MKIKIGSKVVVPKMAKDNETVCTKCCFAKHGRSTRTCPQVEYLGSEGDQHLSRTHLCAMVGNGDLTYFMEDENESS